MRDLENFITEINGGARNVQVPDEQSKFTLEKMPVSRESLLPRSLINIPLLDLLSVRSFAEN